MVSGRPDGPMAQLPNGPMAQWPNGPTAQWPYSSVGVGWPKSSTGLGWHDGSMSLGLPDAIACCAQDGLTTQCAWDGPMAQCAGDGSGRPNRSMGSGLPDRLMMAQHQQTYKCISSIYTSKWWCLLFCCKKENKDIVGSEDHGTFPRGNYYHMTSFEGKLHLPLSSCLREGERL